jgi:UDP-N-acetyl-D-glucosamine dehydrogenase
MLRSVAEPPAHVGIVGLGYVGLPLCVAFAEAGARVTGLDVHADTVAALQLGTSHIEDIPDTRLAAVLPSLMFTTDAAELASADAILICVPTPLNPNREPDLNALYAASEATAGVLRPGQLVVLESTTYPGTTRELMTPILARSGLVAGEDFHVAFSPERVDPGRTDFTLRTTPKVVGGLTPACTARATALYELVCDEIVPVSTPEAAEMSKLLENIFRSVNIALVNELAILCDRMGIDVWEVVDAAATKPYGFMGFSPGPGMGGHCLPVDPFYLAWRARQFDTPTEFIELAGNVNQRMPYYCVERIVDLLNDHSRSVRGARVALVGVSYKAGVGDMRESPANKIVAVLRDKGADVVYHDAHVPELPEFGLASLPLADALAGADAAVIVTAHPGVDHGALARGPVPVLDLRGVTRGEDAPGRVVL